MSELAAGRTRSRTRDRAISGISRQASCACRGRIRVGHNVVMDHASHRRNAVSKRPDVQGGTPVFAGTRVPVTILFDYLEEGESLENFLQQHPSVTREQVLEVLEQAKASVARAT